MFSYQTCRKPDTKMIKDTKYDVWRELEEGKEQWDRSHGKESMNTGRRVTEMT